MQLQAVREIAFPKIEIKHSSLVSGFQVHGKNVGVIRSRQDIPSQRVESTDGWVAAKIPEIALGIYTADCVPLFLMAQDGSAAMVLHAGWRGLAGGIIDQAMSRLRENFGLAAKDLQAIAGPHIGGCCYEVGPEVAGQFPSNSLESREGKIFLSLEKAIGVLLHQLGVVKMFISPWCTKCSDEALFFSYRRKDKGCQLSLAVAISK